MRGRLHSLMSADNFSMLPYLSYYTLQNCVTCFFNIICQFRFSVFFNPMLFSNKFYSNYIISSRDSFWHSFEKYLFCMRTVVYQLVSKNFFPLNPQHSFIKSFFIIFISKYQYSHMV